MATRKRKFRLPTPEPERVPPEIPKANALLAERPEPRFTRPPPMLATRLGSPSYVISVDIETHDWADHEQDIHRVGPFGWYTLKREIVMEYVRIVEIAWAMGATNASTAPVIKSYLVKPDGFEIFKKTTNFHNISHETTCQEGVPLREVLCLFMEDVIKTHRSHHARVVSHHLDPD